MKFLTKLRRVLPTLFNLPLERIEDRTNETPEKSKKTHFESEIQSKKQCFPDPSIFSVDTCV